MSRLRVTNLSVGVARLRRQASGIVLLTPAVPIEIFEDGRLQATGVLLGTPELCVGSIRIHN